MELGELGESSQRTEIDIFLGKDGKASHMLFRHPQVPLIESWPTGLEAQCKKLRT